MKPIYQRFGFTKDKWDTCKKEVRDILVHIASQRQMITYGDLAAQIASVQVEPHDTLLWEIIGDIARDEETAGRGLLSVVVVHKYGDMEPGPGFFELASHFKRDTSDQTKCWIEETKRVYKVWSV